MPPPPGSTPAARRTAPATPPAPIALCLHATPLRASPPPSAPPPAGAPPALPAPTAPPRLRHRRSRGHRSPRPAHGCTDRPRLPRRLLPPPPRSGPPRLRRAPHRPRPRRARARSARELTANQLLAAGAHEHHLERVIALDALAGAEHDALEGRIDEVHRHLSFVLDTAIHAREQGAAAHE